MLSLTGSLALSVPSPLTASVCCLWQCRLTRVYEGVCCLCTDTCILFYFVICHFGYGKPSMSEHGVQFHSVPCVLCVFLDFFFTKIAFMFCRRFDVWLVLIMTLCGNIPHILNIIFIPFASFLVSVTRWTLVSCDERKGKKEASRTHVEWFGKGMRKSLMRMISDGNSLQYEKIAVLLLLLFYLLRMVAHMIIHTVNL